MDAVPEFVRLAAHPVRWRLLAELAGGDLRVRELVERVGEPQNLVSYHLRLLRAGGVLTASRSSFDGRDSYYHLDLDRCAAELAAAGAALHPALAPAPPEPAGARVLFVCTGNSARSPVAEALLRHRTAGRVVVASAGTRPKPALHPHAVRVLADRFGIDVSAQRPRGLGAVARRRFDVVVSLCDRAREESAGLPAHTRHTHWSIREPESYRAFARTAADIDTRVRHLLPALV
jgi:protein-tyrosine-phosphatase/DNA-binding transcriptional ArsR family regulator